MTLSALTLTALAGPTAVYPVNGSLTLDEARAPFASAGLVVPFHLAQQAVLDPRNDARIRLTLEQRFSGSMTLADETIEYAGQTLADETIKYGRAWNTFGFRTTRRVRMDLGVRSRQINHRESTVTLTLASDEALLQDYGLLAATATSPSALTVGAAVELALSTAVPGYTLVTSTGAQTITAESAVWEPGVSAWDYLSPITASANLRLWCDEGRVWHLAEPESIVTPGALLLSATGTVTDASDTVSRDGTDWYDGVVVTYTWTDGSNVRHVQQDVAGDSTSSRVLHVEHDRPFPRAGEAAARLRKVQGRGRVLGVEAVADPSVYPAQEASLSIPDTPTQTGFVQAVTWSFPGDEMVVTTRGLVDTPPGAWSFGPDGVSWDDVPLGMSWDDFEWEDV